MTHGLDTLFSQLGFQPKEQQVFLSLVEHGKQSATELSRRVKIPRATLYSLLDSLLQRGVISREQKRGSRLFLASNLESLKRLVETEREQLKLKEQAASELFSLLAPVMKVAGYAPPKIQVYEGKKSIENMLYDNLPLWRESYFKFGDNTLWGYQDPTFVESYLKWHHFMWQSMSGREKIRLFSNRANIEGELKHRIPNREVRALPASAHFSSSIWIYGEYIVMGMTRQEPHYAVQLKDPIFASNLRTFFELLWGAKFA